jgi:hypothetical protein
VSKYERFWGKREFISIVKFQVHQPLLANWRIVLRQTPKEEARSRGMGPSREKLKEFTASGRLVQIKSERPCQNLTTYVDWISNRSARSWHREKKVSLACAPWNRLLCCHSYGVVENKGGERVRLKNNEQPLGFAGAVVYPFPSKPRSLLEMLVDWVADVDIISKLSKLSPG